MSLANVDVDIVNYTGKKDFQVIPSYVSDKKFTLCLKRLDSNEGWNENIKVFVNFKTLNKTMTVPIGSSTVNRKIVELETAFTLEKSPVIQELDTYNLVKPASIQRISRQNFNKLFDAEVVVLPTYLFAVGIKNKIVYIYNETYEFLYMIELTINNLLSVALTNNLLRMFHFVINAGDGYMEHHYPSVRNTPLKIQDQELKGKKEIEMAKENEYPVLHKEVFVLAQSNQKSVDKTANLPDRYYFCLNRYNEYRSFHQGIPFNEKMNKIVYASLPRGTKHNFTNRRDIQISQREYFYSDAVPKDNIYAPSWIEKEDMVKYKYILDIDGHTSTWDATAWKLNSGSVILKTATCWGQWFYDQYKEWTHYVPIKDDFTDLQEKYSWCESNQAACETMVENCKKLFQEIYRFHNVMQYVENTVFSINNLNPYPLKQRRLFIITRDDLLFDNLKMTSFKNTNLAQIHNIVNKLNDTDILVTLNSRNTDLNKFNVNEFLKRYDEIGKKIVFGAEKNLWPEDLQSVRYKLDERATDTPFKYLNSGFFCAEAGELRRLLEEQIYGGDNFIEQAYFNKILLTDIYSLTLDYKHSLVLNTYLCSKAEIEAIKNGGTPFIHFNAGR